MATLFCACCGSEKETIPIYTAMRLVDVSRSTIYNWMDKGWVHYARLPSGRRMICRDSLTQRV